MSLKLFHVVFVSCSSLLAFLFGGWSFAQSGASGVIGGIVAILLGALMIAYGFWFWQKIRTPEEERLRRRRLLRPLALVGPWLLLAWPRTAEACAVCYGQAEGAMLDGARIGVYLLLATLVAVQTGFVVFFVYLRRRSLHFNGKVDPWWTDVKESLEP